MPWMALGQIVGIVITWWQVIRMIWWESRPSSCRSGCRECFPRRCTTDTANCYVIYRESWAILDFHLVEMENARVFAAELATNPSHNSSVDILIYDMLAICGLDMQF